MSRSYFAPVFLAGAIFLTGCAPTALAASDVSDPLEISAPAGKLKGTRSKGIRMFRGIPYAQPPVGDLRWRPPQPLGQWDGVLKADGFGPACTQPRVKNGFGIYADDIGRTSEDCLTLNVWVPDNAENAPVYVWIHGGALNTGSSKERMYDGRKLAEQGVVVVSINYRLGALGYMAHPELSAESPEGVSGNYGLLDQIAALEWVQTNISAFGGDPNNVTIGGESAGALSVIYLMTTPDAEGLFQKAISQSGYLVSAPALNTEKHGLTSAESMGLAIQTALGASSLKEMREMDPLKVYSKAFEAGFAPLATVDGSVMPKQPYETFSAGEQAKVPLLVGYNTGEIRSLRMLAPAANATGAETYAAKIRYYYGDLAEDFLTLYPPNDLEGSLTGAARDALYGWTSERMALDQTALGQPAYLYLFDHGYPAADNVGMHAFHASELPYVFGTFHKTPPNWPAIPKSKAEYAISDAMISYWTSFMTSGTPIAEGQTNWPAYDDAASYLSIADTITSTEDLHPGMYELHETSVCRRYHAGTLSWNWNVGLWSPVIPPESAACQ